MQVTLEWFEALCQELTRNPVNATKTIELFRETDYAVEACTSFLQSPQSSHVAKFQAISILQYACLNRWIRLSKSDHDELKNISFAMISRYVNQLGHSVPAYLLNKLIQVYVSFWKRSWLDSGEGDKNQFFQSISLLLNSAQGRTAGVVVLRSIVEEFSTKSFAEANLSFAHHIQIKTAFQGVDLQRVFILTVEFVSVIFQSLGNITSAGDSSAEVLFKTLAELLKLLTEVISWDFSDDGGQHQNPSKGNTGAVTVQYSKLPREWATHLIQPSFIDNIYAMYRQLLHYRQGQLSCGASPGGTVSDLTSFDLGNCLLETRNLILCLSSINGPIFADVSEKTAMASYITNYSIQLVDDSAYKLAIGGPEISSLTIESPCYETGSTVRATVRYEELELFVHTMYRLLNNFKVATLCTMPNFNTMLVTLMNVSYESAMEILSISKDMMVRVEQLYGQGNANETINFLKSLYDTKILDTWRGDVLNSVLDIWSLILEDPTILSILTAAVPPSSPRSPRSPAGANLSSSNILAANQNLNFKIFLLSMSQQLYPVLFESILGIYIFESILTADEEIDEDDELIESRSVEDMLRGISLIGSVNFVNSGNILTSFLNSFAAAANAQHEQNMRVPYGNEMINLVILEKLRIGVLFSSYLLIENYHENSADCEHESPTISVLVLQSLTSDSQQTLTLLHQLVHSKCDILRLQVYMLCSGRGDLLSPTLLQLLYRFFTEYTLRYVDADASKYSREDIATVPGLTSIHGVEFNQIVDLLMSAAGNILSMLPLESDLIASICECISAIADTSNPERLQSIVLLPSVGTIAQIVMNVTESNGNGQTARLQLNADGYVQVFQALGRLLVKSHMSEYFGQVCSSVYTLLSTTNGQDPRILERSIASLNGLAKCPVGLDKILHSLFDGSFVILKPAIVNFKDSDGTLLQYLNLVNDYTENQLSRLPNNSCFELYKTSYHLLQLFAKRFSMQDIVFSTNAASQDSVTLFKNDSLLLLLELLNHLSSKDFSFSEDSSDEFNQSFESEVRIVLLYGFQMMSLIINVDVLTNFPSTASKYYSFVSYITTTYMSEFVQWLNGLSAEEGKQKLGDFFQQLLWAVGGSIDGGVARQALQCIQMIAIHQHRSMQLKSKIVGFNGKLHSEVLLLVLDRLLEVVLVPQEKEFDLSWDRVDALGGALISFISLDTARYQQVAGSLVQRHISSATQQILLENLTKVSSNRGVNLQSIEKANRMLFVQNFRDLVTQIKSLNLKVN